jgi:hypothetical protein
MAPPNKSGSRDIDLFHPGQSLPESSDLLVPQPGSLDRPACRRRYHSIQLVIITGVFACGGLICSLLLVDGNEDFPQPHHWLRQSYSPPAMASPQAPATTPSTPPNPPIRLNNEDKSALRQRRISARKSACPPARLGRANIGLRPPVALRSYDRALLALRAKWRNFTGTIRRHTMSLNFVRNLDFGSGSKA